MHKLTMNEKLIFLSKSAKANRSNFLVASIIKDVNGTEWTGANVEYAIPTNGICAERNAISTALTSGMNFGDLAEVHILGRRQEDPNTKAFTPPCGVCRQAIFEASNGKAKVFLYNMEDEVKEFDINELLPFAFNGEEV